MKKVAKPKIKRKICYACGPDNPQGMRLKFAVYPEDPVVRATFTLAHRYQGPPASVHGGIIATLVDEAMGKLSRLDGVVAMTAELNVEYLRPVPLGRKILIEARPAEHRGRSYWRECTIHDAKGTLLVRGRGRFVKVAERDGNADSYE
jgi:uncharacterized protein (TIGR00369 family)